MKSDNELNRLIAERVLQIPLEPICAYYHCTDDAVRDEDGWSGWCYTCGSGVVEATPEPRRYCTDPAAWGALFVWVSEQGIEPELTGRDENIMGNEAYQLLIYQHSSQKSTDQPTAVITKYATTPGRALVLATLAAWGIEVE